MSAQERTAWNQRLQTHLDWFFRHYNIPWPAIHADGVMGAGTKAAIKQAKYLLGYGQKYCLWATGTDETFIQRLHHPTYRMGPLSIARGIARRRAAVRADLGTVQGCAKFLLSSPNVTFWDGLSTGSDRRKFVQLASSGVAYCDHTQSNHRVKLNLMQFLVDCAKAGPMMVNALTGGTHTAQSHHYADPCSATDIDLSRGSTSRREQIARQHGGQRNFETSHEHYDL